MHALEGTEKGDYSKDGGCTKMVKPQTETSTNMAAIVKLCFLLVRLANI